MKAKLVKTTDDQGFFYTLSGKNLPENYVLSLKNCQAIERGYDLDELADELASKHHNRFTLALVALRKGMELIGDKKFSEEDMLKAFEKGASFGTAKTGNTHYFNEVIQSLQQTEWDVTFNPDEKDSEGCLILKTL